VHANSMPNSEDFTRNTRSARTIEKQARQKTMQWASEFHDWCYGLRLRNRSKKRCFLRGTYCMRDKLGILGVQCQTDQMPRRKTEFGTNNGELRIYRGISQLCHQFSQVLYEFIEQFHFSAFFDGIFSHYITPICIYFNYSSSFLGRSFDS